MAVLLALKSVEPGVIPLGVYVTPFEKQATYQYFSWTKTHSASVANVISSLCQNYVGMELTFAAETTATVAEPQPLDTMTPMIRVAPVSWYWAGLLL